MEPKHFTYKYLWNSLSIVVDCTRCGNNIVLQDFNGNPECSDCGNVNKKSWQDIIREVDIIGMKRGESDHKIMMGSINGNVQLEHVDSVACHHCKQALSLPEHTDLNGYACNHCNQPLTFREYKGIDDLVFYKASAQTKQKENIQMIAVRCVSCGAPLEADPTKNNFNCKFCSTENILPLSLRYKIVLDDVFVGERLSKLPKLQAFVRDGQIVKQALRENGKESFTDAELDKVLLNEKDDSAVFHQIMYEFKYLPSDSLLKEIFNTSKNETVIKQVGLRLQKSTDEIDARLNEIKGIIPQKTTTHITNQSIQTKTTKSKLKSPFMIIIMIVFVITLIAMINLILN